MEYIQYSLIYSIGYAVVFLVGLELFFWLTKLTFKSVTKFIKPDFKNDKKLIELTSLLTVILTVAYCIDLGIFIPRAVTATLVFAVFELLSILLISEVTFSFTTKKED